MVDMNRNRRPPVRCIRMRTHPRTAPLIPSYWGKSDRSIVPRAGRRMLTWGCSRPPQPSRRSDSFDRGRSHTAHVTRVGLRCMRKSSASYRSARAREPARAQKTERDDTAIVRRHRRASHVNRTAPSATDCPGGQIILIRATRGAAVLTTAQRPKQPRPSGTTPRRSIHATTQHALGLCSPTHLAHLLRVERRHHLGGAHLHAGLGGRHEGLALEGGSGSLHV